VYCDPPYLITTASYNENGGWTEAEETRLLETLDGLSARGIKFALSNVLEHNGRQNQTLMDWIQRTGARVTHLDFNYNNSNYQSKSKGSKTDEVLITNY
jgi:site-specific DNA-adenine methylase